MKRNPSGLRSEKLIINRIVILDDQKVRWKLIVKVGHYENVLFASIAQWIKSNGFVLRRLRVRIPLEAQFD